MSTPDYITIALTQGQQTVIDSQFDEVTKYKWQAKWCEDTQSYYAACGANSIAYKTYKQFALARAIMQLHLGRLLLRHEIVDHVNHDTLDNRLKNLALKSVRGNQLNRRKNKNNTSGYKGVYRSGSRWMAIVSNNQINVYLGSFVNILNAARMYDRAYLYFGGVDAVISGLNFPDEIGLRKQELQENVYKWMK